MSSSIPSTGDAGTYPRRRNDGAGAWDSALSVDEFAVLSSVGLTPVGMVAGTCAHLVGLPGGYGSDPAFSLSYGFEACEPVSQAMAGGRRQALARMEQQATEVQAHGVVGVRLLARPLGQGALVEFTAIGTAVVCRSASRPGRPFLSHLSGQGVSSLLHVGLVPCGIAVGCGSVWLGPGIQSRDRRGVLGRNWEIANTSDGYALARDRGMRELEAEARAQGADGVVGLRTEFTSVHMTKSATSVKLKLVNFVAVGTAMTRFAAASAMAPISALVLGDAPR